jgi:hypothetical protein
LLDFAAAKKHCTVREHCRPSPPATDLVVTVAPVTVKSGRTAAAEIVLANATAAPLTFDLENTFSLEATIVGTDGKPVNRVGDCGGGGHRRRPRREAPAQANGSGDARAGRTAPRRRHG